MKKRVLDCLRFFKATLVVWLMAAVFTQGFAAGLSCLHHFNPSQQTTKTDHSAIHSMHQISNNQLANHYHHSILKAQLAESMHSVQLNADSHCDMQTAKNFSNSDCKCTHFISVELLQTPALALRKTLTFSAPPTFAETFLSTDFNSIYRPPLNA